MARREEIIAWLDELLEIAAFDDYGQNGLQVPGTAEVTKVATGVTPNLEFLVRARDGGAELAIAHHLLFLGDGPRSLSEQMAERLRTVLGAELSLAAYHLPLDAHPEHGNNALLCARLGLEPQERRFAEFKGRPIGVVGRPPEPLPAAELVRRVSEAVGRDPLVFDAGPERVSSVGIVTGGASSAIAEAGALGLDALVTGEPSEHVMGDARELGIHFIAAGHYATETFGVRRLGELVAERFGVDHEFIDVPNPI
ncbi:MAG: Nif3-like dinuclear metal center hexameric protein [Solirubrobacterales bacterium]